MVLVHDNDLKHILGATDTNQTVSKDHTSISTIFDSVHSPWKPSSQLQWWIISKSWSLGLGWCPVSTIQSPLIVIVNLDVQKIICPQAIKVHGLPRSAWGWRCFPIYLKVWVGLILFWQWNHSAEPTYYDGPSSFGLKSSACFPIYPMCLKVYHYSLQYMWYVEVGDYWCCLRFFDHYADLSLWRGRS